MTPFDYTTSAPLEEPLQCGSCGKPAPELFTPYWDRSIQVGMCCAVHSDECPDEPVCPKVLEIARLCTSVKQFCEALKVHNQGHPEYCRAYLQPASRQGKTAALQGSATEEAA